MTISVANIYAVQQDTQSFLMIEFYSSHKAGLLLSFPFWLDAGKSQYPEGSVTGHLASGFSWFPWVLQQMLGWFPTVPSCHYMLLM